VADAPVAERYVCVAAGKAAVAMAGGAAAVLGDRLRTGAIVSPGNQTVAGFESIRGGHPIPDGGSERGGRRALELAESLRDRETLLVLLSGGASALMAVPADGLTLADKQQTTAQLLRAGADIHALNTIRKHLSAIKGGWLADRAAWRVRTYVISDVVGDDVSVIASGPTVFDTSTFGDARGLIDRFGGAGAFPAPVVERLDRGVRGEIRDTPKAVAGHAVPPALAVIGSRRNAMVGAAARAAALGYEVLRVDDAIVGNARDSAVSHLRAVLARAADLRRPACVVSSGETTVRVTGSGRGGRNQEFALAGAEALAHAGGEAMLASVGTDGIDGPTDAAGAIADATTLDRARRANLAPAQFLHDNNSYAFFDALGDLVRTGPTGTNVGDLQVILLA
jgi:hydroxypyruvate reductase